MSLTYRKNWKTGETITPAKANTHITGLISRMYDKNMAICEVKTSDNRMLDLTASNIFLPFARRMRLTLNTLENETVRVFFSGSVVNTRTSGTAIGFSWFDVLMDDETYISSMDTTAATDGIMVERDVLVPSIKMMNANVFITQLPEGQHTFELVAKSNNQNHAVDIQPAFQFGVESYGINIGQLIAANHT